MGFECNQGGWFKLSEKAVSLKVNMSYQENRVIRVLLVLPFFYPHRGGSQKYAEEIYASMLKKHPNVKVDVLCYNTDRVQKFEEYRGFSVYRIGCLNVIPARFALPYPWELVVALIKLSKNKYDFVNTHIRFFDPTWWLWIYGKLIGAKSIFTGHVAVHPVYQNKFVEVVAKTVDLTIARFSLKFYDYITFTNQAAQKFFANKLGVHKTSHLIYGGVDTSFFRPTNSKINRVIPKLNMPVPEGTVVITYVGRFIWTKGITYLYDAAQAILRNPAYRTKALFVFAGPGDLEEEIKQRIKNDGLEKSILLTGNLSYSEVRDLLAISNVFVNPSHHNEGFPNTVLEAGASECFVIATDNAGTAEVVQNYETGLLIPQRDTAAITKAITWTLENQDSAEKIAINFRKVLIEKFDWNVISEHLYQLFIK